MSYTIKWVEKKKVLSDHSVTLLDSQNATQTEVLRVRQHDCSHFVAQWNGYKFTLRQSRQGKKVRLWDSGKGLQINYCSG